MRTNSEITKLLLFAAPFVLFLAPAATADTWNKKTIVTFPEPVELPGRVTLPNGSYVMKLLDSQSNRHIVQVLNRDENKVYATILAIPSERLEPAEKTIITFYETPAGQASFIRTWYYPGDTIGQEFAYPKDRAMYLARAARTNVPIAPESPGGYVSTEATPEEKEVARADTVPGAETEPAGGPSTAPAAEPEKQGAAQEPAKPEQQPKLQTLPDAKPVESEELPATASMAPYLALVGGILLSAAILLRAVRMKSKHI